MIYFIFGICIVCLFIWDICSTAKNEKLKQEYINYINTEYRTLK